MDTFVYTTYINASPERLWAALTEPAFTQRYWGVALHSDWQVGSPITWEVGGLSQTDDQQVVLAVDPPKRLSYTWHAVTAEFLAAVGGPAELVAAADEPRSKVTFELEPIGDFVKLTVTHDGFATDSAMLAAVSGGWPMVLASLKSLLETGEPLPDH